MSLRLGFGRERLVGTYLVEVLVEMLDAIGDASVDFGFAEESDPLCIEVVAWAGRVPTNVGLPKPEESFRCLALGHAEQSSTSSEAAPTYEARQLLPVSAEVLAGECSSPRRGPFTLD